MDLDNENGEETPTVTTEKVAETESSSIQELTDVKDVADSIKVLDSTEAEAKNILNEISVNPECSPKVENDETAQSPVPDDKLCLETDIGDSNTPQENEKALDPVVSSPHSSGSEGSLREINLGDEKASEHFEVIDNSNLSEASNDNLIESRAAPETLVSGEVSEELNVAILGSPQKVENASSVEQAIGDEKASEHFEVIDNSNLSEASNDNLIESGAAPETVVSEKVSEELNVAILGSPEKIENARSVEQAAGDFGQDVSGDAKDIKIENEDDNINTNALEKMEEEGESSSAPKTENDVLDEKVEETNHPSDAEELIKSNKLEKKNNDEDEDNKSSAVSVIDTSIFPKPPIGRVDNVVVANCFELDEVSKTESHNEFDPADHFTPSGFEISDMLETTDSKSAFPGPSDDREDISDEELDLESNIQNTHGGLESNPVPRSNNPMGGFDLEPIVNKSDNLSLHSSDVGDIIDLKLEDAALKSIGSSCDKVSNEDLEAVSDDELPNASHVADVVLNQNTSTNLLDDREEVSSSEDEEMDKPQHLDATPISSEDEFPSHNDDEVSAIESEQGFVASAQETESHSRIESLEAEPISDEEDNNIVSEEPGRQETSFDDGEAGEIKSPALGSPISEQGDLILGEVEPVSADESQDTDGELPSGDEAEKGGDKDGNDKKFESIDSDEDIPGDNRSKDETEASKRIKDKGGYMETISDEENLDCEDSGKREGSSSSPVVEAVGKEESQSQVEKGRIPTSFNEHQVELDYEEGYGEDGGGDARTESKDDESKSESKLTGIEDGECEDRDQGLASDKDEGELSDDDCEEGEIKEPGQRKMFVKPICRFFQRGHCTWGVSCRFLHPGVNDKGNYQMIEIPGFKPVGIHARLGVASQYPEQPPPQEEVELPPPPMPDVPHVETAWERGLRIAKEQRKKASERKEKEPDFEEKRLNLSVEEDRELNKENERTPRIIPKDPYYDQQAYEVDEYYKIPRDPWHTGHYENFEVRYHHPQNSYSPPYREKPPSAPPPMRYTRPLSPPIDKFGRNRDERPEPPDRHHEPMRVSDFPPPVAKHPDEWIDPWRRSKSPKQRKPRSRSRGRKTRRSLSDSSDSSRSSHSSSGSSRSSRSGSSSSSSRSRSPEPAPPGVDRMDRHDRYGGDQPRSMVSVRGPDGRGSGGGYNRNNNEFRYGRGNQGFSSSYSRGGGSSAFGGGGDGRNPYHSRQDNYRGGRGGGGGPGGYNNYRGGYGHRGGGGGGGGPYNSRDPRGRYPGGRNMSPSRGGRGPTPDRPLPYTRPRPKSRSSSRSSSSRSRSRSRSKSSDSSNSRSSSNSSRSSSSSSSSAGSADSDHLYRDLGSPSKANRHPASQKKRPGMDNRKDSRNAKSNHHMSSSSQSASRHPPPPSGMDGRVPHPPRSPPHSRSSGGDPKYSQIPLPPPSSSSSASRSDSKYASRNAPQPPVKAKDPLKVVGQKSNIKLTLLPKQQQQSNLGDRPNPLASPPHKRRMSERDQSPPSPPPPTKRPNLTIQASSLRMATDKAAKLQMRLDKAKSPPPGSLPPPPSSTSSSSSFTQRSKNPPPPPSTSPQKQLTSKSRPSGESVSSKPATKAPSGGSAPSSNPTGAKSKKSMSSRREELLKQLKAVEDAIARKKFKMS